MKLNQIWKIDLHNFCYKNPISEISKYIFLGLAERNPVEPLEQLFHLVLANRWGLHICQLQLPYQTHTYILIEQMTTVPPYILRFAQKRIGKNIFLVGKNYQEALNEFDSYHQEIKKMEKRQTMYHFPRMLEQMHKGEENKKYWTDTIRHYHQKKISFFVTSVLAARKVSVPIR